MSTAATPRPTLAAAARLPFEEQIQFFRRKLNLPTQAWDDIQKSAHDRAFIVAGAMKADLLADLRAAIDQAIAQGKSVSWFHKEFKNIAAKHGWVGFTGDGSKKGVAWRARTIYATNLRTSYAAGRWAQLTDPEMMRSRPYWRYVHRSSDNPRLQHKAWHGLVLPAAHAWFSTHYPPNGLGCKCRIEALNQRDLERLGKSAPDAAPDDGTYEHTTPDGRTVTLPRGVQYGWDYAPGRSAAASWSQLIDDKLLKLDAPIGAMLWAHVQPVMADEIQNRWTAWLHDLSTGDKRTKSHSPVVGVLSRDLLAAMKAKGLPEPQVASVTARSGLIDGPKAERHAASQDALPLQYWEHLPDMLQQPLAVLRDIEHDSLLYILRTNDVRHPQVAVRLDAPGRGKEKKKTANRVVSGYMANLEDLRARVKGKSLELLLGSLDGH